MTETLLKVAALVGFGVVGCATTGTVVVYAPGQPAVTIRSQDGSEQQAAPQDGEANQYVAAGMPPGRYAIRARYPCDVVEVEAEVGDGGETFVRVDGPDCAAREREAAEAAMASRLEEQGEAAAQEQRRQDEEARRHEEAWKAHVQEVARRLADDDLSGAEDVVERFRTEYPDSAWRVGQLREPIDRARSLAGWIAKYGAKPLGTPRSLFSRADHALRGVPDTTAAGSDRRTLRRGDGVLVVATARGGWVGVTTSGLGGEAPTLGHVEGWTRQGQLTSVDLRERENKRAQLRSRAEERRQARQAEEQARLSKELLRRSGTPIINAEVQAALIADGLSPGNAFLLTNALHTAMVMYRGNPPCDGALLLAIGPRFGEDALGAIAQIQKGVTVENIKAIATLVRSPNLGLLFAHSCSLRLEDVGTLVRVFAD